MRWEQGKWGQDCGIWLKGPDVHELGVQGFAIYACKLLTSPERATQKGTYENETRVAVVPGLSQRA